MSLCTKMSDELHYYKTLSRNLINIYWSKVKYQPSNEDGLAEISDRVIMRTIDIVKDLDPQPDLVCPTGRHSMQMEWDLDDGSYLEFEIFEDKIATMQVDGAENGSRDYSHPYYHQLPFTGSDSMIKDKIYNFIMAYEDKKKDREKELEIELEVKEE